MPLRIRRMVPRRSRVKSSCGPMAIRRSGTAFTLTIPISSSSTASGFSITRGDRLEPSHLKPKLAGQLLITFWDPTRNIIRAPVFPGHAFTTWVHRTGVAAFGYGTFWSEDGFTFVKTSDWTPKTIGLYCPENFGNGVNNNAVSWGMKVKFPDDRCRYITRMELPLLDLSNLKRQNNK